MKKTFVRIQLSACQIAILLSTFLLMNLLVLGGTWAAANYFQAHGWNGPSTVERNVMYQMDLALENVAATWYSSMLLLTTAVAMFICFLADRQNAPGRRQLFFSYGWLVFALVFATLSFDEMGSIHEYFGKGAYDKTGLKSGFGAHIGITVFYSLIALVAIFMVGFGLLQLRRTPWSFVLVAIGVLLYISNPLQEHLEWIAYAEEGRRSVLSLLTEEGSELFGTLCFLTAAILYAVHATRRLPSGASMPAISAACSVSGNTVLSLLSLALGGMAVLLFGLQVAFGDITDIRIGIPKNWMPSAVAYAAGLLSIYLAINTKPDGKKKLILLLSAAFAIAVSVYYGSNLYASKGPLSGNSLSLLVLAALAMAGTGLFLTSRSIWFRLGVVAWVVLTVLAFSTGKNFSVEFSFFGFSALLMSLSRYALLEHFQSSAAHGYRGLDVVAQLSKVESAA